MASPARLSSRVDAGLLAGCVLLSFIALVISKEDREPIAAALRQTIVAPLVSLQRGAERWRSAWAASDRQQMIVDSLAMRAVKANALVVENDQLRKLLGLGTRLEWGFIPAEALHSTAPGEGLVTTLTLTAGSSAGVQKYSPVVAGEGLVGMVQTADPSMSIAILYTHPSFAASAMTADGTTTGIIYPHLGGSGDPYSMEFRGVAMRYNLTPGTVVYTSGVGHTYPRGVVIGTIVQEMKTAEVWTRTYLVRPAVPPSRINSVAILTPQRVTQGTGNVWGATINVDSATRRIAAAGDSIAKQAALLQEKARQAALDSMKRATIDSVRRSLGAAVIPAADSAAAAAQRGAQPARGTTGVPGQTPVRRDSSRARRDSLRPDTLRSLPLGSGQALRPPRP